METFLSVIICTHNPREEYLRRTLASLRSQTLGRDRWELVLLDNASTHCLADYWDLSWHPQGRHVREDELGLTAARLRGIAETAGDLLVFVDDDNELATDYLERATTIHASFGYLGVFGAGKLEPEFEVQPAPDLTERLGMLALRTVGTSQWSNNAGDYSCIPWGAGMIVTRRVASAYRELLSRLKVMGILGRRGRNLYSGEDDLFSVVAAATGLGFGIFPQLRVTHLISAGRLKRGYFLRLIHDHAYSNGVLSYLVAGRKHHRINGFRVAHILLHGLRNSCFSMRCQWAAARGEAAAARFVADQDLRPSTLSVAAGLH